jgi:hypothetical protein
LNERIQEFAEQAKIYALDLMIKIPDREQALKVYSESYDTKFAELIVQECASIGYDASYDECALNVSDKIKEHFGLK